MVGWHHPLDGHEFEQALGAGDGQGGLACCGPWGHGIRHAIPRVNHKQHMSTKKRNKPRKLGKGKGSDCERISLFEAETFSGNPLALNTFMDDGNL